MASRFLFCLLAFFSFDVFANDLNIQVNYAAHHWNRDAVSKYNLKENNIGFGVEYDTGQTKSAIGFYRNSLGRNSTYLTESYLPLKLGDLKVGVTVGCVTGYLLPVTPAIALAASYQYKHYGVNFTIIPDVSVNSNPFFGFAAVQFFATIN